MVLLSYLENHSPFATLQRDLKLGQVRDSSISTSTLVSKQSLSLSIQCLKIFDR
jgi:hypothetical protein